MEKTNCTYENLKNMTLNTTLTACEFVQKYCDNAVEAIDFPEFIFCSVDKSPFVILPLIAVASTMIFHFLGSTSEEYLAPALSAIAEKFRFSEALAGVTLVALANGAPDVISAFSIASGDPKGFFTALGSIFGANLFTTTIVLARCIFGAKKLKVESFGPSRDLLFFIIASFYLLTLGLTGTIPVGFAIGFLLIYIVYFLFVLYGEYLAKKRKRQNEINEHTEEGRTKLDSYHVVASFGRMESLNDHVQSDYVSISDSSDENHLSSSESFFGKRHQPHSMIYKFKWIYQKSKQQLILQYKTKKWQEKTLWEKVVTVYEFPLDILRSLTIPCIDKSRWDRRIAVFTPAFGSALIMWTLHFHPNWWAWVIVCAVGLLLGGAIWKISHKDEIPKPLMIPLCIFAIITACLWIKYVADIFQDLIVMIKLVSGLPGAFLGLTLVAWGNSTNDFFVDYALAKQGYGKMAVAGIYGGQLFNLLIGFGIVLIKTCSIHGTLPFNLLDGEHLSVLNFTILLFVLFNFVLQLAFLCSTRFNMGRGFATFLIGYYIVFFVLVTIFSLAGVF